MSQQKTNAQKVFSETKIFTNFKIKNKMKNLKSMTLNELKVFNGGELPGAGIDTRGSISSISNFFTGVKDFCSGFISGWKAAN